jgi:spermidine/putrescine transport system substrate-binding protein
MSWKSCDACYIVPTGSQKDFVLGMTHRSNGMYYARLSVLTIRSVMVLFWVGVLLLGIFLSEVIQSFKRERSINIFTWPMLLDIQYLHKFEQETGIHINVSYYENNEELFSKLQATKGVGYDLVIPSDYVVELLVKNKLLKKLDMSRLTCMSSIDPKLLGLYCDPANDYTVPFFWAVYGLGVDTRYFKDKPFENSWALIFDKNKVPPAVGMLDLAREDVILAASYLFGTAEFSPTQENIDAIKNLLKQQKNWVSAYTESNVEHLLLSKSSPVVVAMGPDILRIKRQYPYIDFIIPREGSFAVVDSFAIPAQSSKEALVYQLINYLMKPEVVEHHKNKFGMCSPLQEVPAAEEDRFCPTQEQFRAMKFFRTSMPDSLLNDIWIQLMAY